MGWNFSWRRQQRYERCSKTTALFRELTYQEHYSCFIHSEIKYAPKNPFEAWPEVLYGIFQVRQLQNWSVRNSAAGAHASLGEHGGQVVTLPSRYPKRSVIQCITNTSALSLLEWLELCTRCQKWYFVHTTEWERHQILNEAELSIMTSNKSNCFFFFFCYLPNSDIQRTNIKPTIEWNYQRKKESTT